MSRTTIGPFVTRPTGVRAAARRLERLPGQLVVALDGLVRVGRRANGHLLARPRRPSEFPRSTSGKFVFTRMTVANSSPAPSSNCSW